MHSAFGVFAYDVNPSQNIIGIVFYSGEDILSFGNKEQPRYALPLHLFF